MFDAPRLRALALPVRADEAVLARIGPELDRLADQYAITMPLRRAHLVAQLCHESAGFNRLEENLNYSADGIVRVWRRLAARANELAHAPEKLANAAYASRTGNGDEASGDGWTFRGRGLIQLTGRDNYRVFGVAIGVTLEVHPDVAREPETAVEVALAYWRAHGINEAADRDDAADVTRRINPALEGLPARRLLTDRAKTIFI